jgi:hypothetical protein
MSEPVQIAIGLLFLIAVFVLTRYVIAWQTKRATLYIVRDLERHAALDPITAIELPYARFNPLRMGMRDYRAKAL